MTKAVYIAKMNVLVVVCTDKKLFPSLFPAKAEGCCKIKRDTLKPAKLAFLNLVRIFNTFITRLGLIKSIIQTYRDRQIVSGLFLFSGLPARIFDVVSNALTTPAWSLLMEWMDVLKKLTSVLVI